MVTAENAERRPLTTTGAPETNLPSTTIPDASDVARLLELSAERDVWLLRLEAAWREGWDACLDYLADHVGGRMHPERPTNIEILRWGPGGREHFANPRIGDYMGGAV